MEGYIKYSRFEEFEVQYNKSTGKFKVIMDNGVVSGEYDIAADAIQWGLDNV